MTNIDDLLARDGRSRRPQFVYESRWNFPDPQTVGSDGLVGVGADLDASTLVAAYRTGVFPWPHPDIPLPWYSPDPRGVLHLDEFHCSRSLRRRLRTCGWTTTVDVAFDQVVRRCSERAEGSWVTDEMRSAYRDLHDLGWANSLEVWDGDDLVGGVYGVRVGGIFTGESMFHREADASKVALADLVARFLEAGGRLIDVQLTTPHLESLGVREMDRGHFLELLGDLATVDARMQTRPLPVSRLAETDA